jgi:nondiscriminating aspartyl-tRNA synthetase
MNPDDFHFYLEIFKYAMPPHGGLALGTERLTQQFLGLTNVREASFFPRDRFRLTP